MILKTSLTILTLPVLPFSPMAHRTWSSAAGNKAADLISGEVSWTSLQPTSRLASTPMGSNGGNAWGVMEFTCVWGNMYFNGTLRHLAVILYKVTCQTSTNCDFGFDYYHAPHWQQDYVHPPRQVEKRFHPQEGMLSNYLV